MNKNNLFGQFYIIARANFKNDAQLAKALGITRGTLGLYTKKKDPRSPNISTLESWCDTLGIEIVENIFKWKN